jgi:hypothetical protein
MATIKKVFADVHNLLVANKDKQVSDILSKLEDLMGSSRGANGSTYFLDAAGVCLAAKCSYFEKWFAASEFHPKAGSPSGLNSLTKTAASFYAKQKREAATAKADLLKKVGAGEFPYDQVGSALQEIDAAQTAILPVPEGMVSYDSLEAYKDANGLIDDMDDAA